MKLQLIKPVIGAIALCVGFLIYSYHPAQVRESMSRKIDACMQDHKNFSGVILIARKDAVLCKKAFGYANYEFKMSNSYDTRFPIASNTKFVTAVAIMLLQEQGLLRVHDTLENYIPGFSNTITIHHLLTHTSGIPNYYQHWDTMCRCKNGAEMVNAATTWQLEFVPGSQYCYSNTGYIILAYVIEKVSGITYEAFLRKHIFEPLKMCNSGSICSEQVIAHKASGYLSKNDALCNAPSIMHPATLLGNGDLYSTVDDMHTFMHALFSGRIINQESLNALLSPHVMMEGSQDRSHGYGCFVDMHHGKQIVEYTGAVVGFLSKVVRVIADDPNIIIVTNREDMHEFTNICDGLLEIIA